MPYKTFLHIGGVLHGKQMQLHELETENTGFILDEFPRQLVTETPEPQELRKQHYKRQAFIQKGSRVDVMVYDHLSDQQAMDLLLNHLGGTDGIVEKYCHISQQLPSGNWQITWHSLEHCLEDVKPVFFHYADKFSITKVFYSKLGEIKVEYFFDRIFLRSSYAPKDIIEAEVFSRARKEYRRIQGSTPAGSSSGGSTEITDPPIKLVA